MSIQLQEIQSIYISQNRLVEGKDYKRAEWLKGDGTAYIDTLITIPNEIVHVKTRIINTSNDYDESITQNYNSLPFSNRNDVVPQPHISIIQRRDLGELYNDIYSPRKVSSYTIGDVIEIDVVTSRIQNGEASLHFFYSDATNLTPKCWDGKISNFEVESLESAFKISLIPCRLLRPIPATLDANGIARSAGECGMVDSISGKFYGNVASSGSFTVENLDESGTVEDTRLHQIYTNKLVENVDYKCYDWLERKSSAMGQMFNLTLSNTADTVVRIWNYKAQGTNGRDMIYLNNTNQSKYFIFPDYNAVGQTLMRHSDQSTSQVIATGQDVELTLRSGKVNNITTLAYKSIGICHSTATGNLTKVGRIYSDTYDYVPCKLLRDIPANRTMNGKSYPAGTMGMIEKVSKKFQSINNAATLTVSYDEWLKNCSIQFDANYLGWTMQYPPTISYQGRVKVANLPDELTDFGFVKLSKTQVVIGKNVWSFNNWGSDTWATFDVSYGGGGGCGCSINGSSVGSQQEQVATELSCSIDLQDIIQINEIEFIAYIDQQTTHRVKFTRVFDETLNKQYLISDYDNTRIYAD